jgi:uncharacterized protein (TIGR02217 family)
VASVNLPGVHLLPSTGEGSYDTIPMVGWQRDSSGLANATILNFFSNQGLSGSPPATDYANAMDQLQAQHPECTTVSLVIAWLFNSEDAATCNVYPATNFLLGEFAYYISGSWVLNQNWMVSSLTQADYPGLIPGPVTAAGDFVYGGTPSDPSVVRCIRDLKARGFKVVFYPFLLGAGSGYPWRGRITSQYDLSQGAANDAATFMGSATVSDFTPDPVNLTVAYSGFLFDWTYRRMILHYANLCTVAGGVNLFVIGSELRGLEILRGPNWTQAGTTDGSGNAIWDYPFVAALNTLTNDVRATFDNLGYAKSLANLENLIVYSPDWSSWMGWQHPGENGQWPHLDQLYANPNIDLVSFDNYLPLTDWTTASNGGADADNWILPKYAGAWPPPSVNPYGLGLSGPPGIYNTAYIKGQIEGGQYFDWYYNDGGGGAHGVYGLDPLGSDLQVTLPAGDRLAQTREPYYADQQILANKQLRWWWNNLHYAVYANSSGAWVPQGPQTEWVPNSKSIQFLEYGIPAVDKGTNEPNVFFDAKSSESATPYWSIWAPAPDLSYLPLRDDTIQAVAMEAIYEYWNVDGANATVGGLPMINWAFSCAWNWDARPFPTFPIESQNWGDTGNWQQGDWLNGIRMTLPPPPPSPPPTPPAFQTFPSIATLSWSVHIKPKFSTLVAEHVSGNETRAQRWANPYFDIELTYEVLRSAAAYQELQTIAGFFEEMSGEDSPFWFGAPGLGSVAGQAIGTGDGATTVFPLVASIPGSAPGAGYVGPVYGTSGISAIYLNGVAQGSGWSVSSGYLPAITFATAPGAGVAITGDFGVLWLCRFADDVQDFEEFMAQLFELRTLRLMTARP